MRTLLPALTLGLLATIPLSAQESTLPPQTVQQTVPGSYIVIFEERSFDLERYRNAIRANRSPAEIRGIIADMEAAVRSDQAPFVNAVEAFGGRVSDQWWIINAAAVENIDAKRFPQLKALPNIRAIEPVRVFEPVNNTARNSAHHEADQANLQRNATNDLVIGTGVSVAILDTGVDGVFSGSGMPNPGYFVDANTANNQSGGLSGSRLKAVFGTSGRGSEDDHGHGTHVSGSVASGYSGYKGMAPNAWIVGVKISTNSAGSATAQTMVAAWQLVATERANHNILVANNSYSGSPSLTDPIQMALDSTALNADVLCCVAAGNGGSNTSFSQNGWNGLAVAAVNKNSLTPASFSAQGPLSGSGRTFPDIAAVGVNVNSMSRDTTASTSNSGTSMASPMVAGGGALVRQAVPSISALEAKAVLLNTTKHVQNQRNSYGLGLMDCDEAVTRALAGEFYTIQMVGQGATYSRTFTAQATGPMALTATWMHPPGGSFDNVDMRIYQGTTVVASDLNPLNSYESVDFNVTANTTYRIELTRVGTAVINSLDVAIAGLVDTPVTPPTLSNIQPAVVSNNGTDTVTLTGVLDRIQHIDVGAERITNYAQPTQNTITFQLPAPALIGSNFPVSVTNTAGTSNQLSLSVTGTHPVELEGPAFAIRNFAFTMDTLGDANWGSLLFLSTSNQPSTIPNIINLGIGNNFSILLQAGSTVQGARGQGSFNLTLPSTVPAGNIYFEVITFDPANLTAPIETSNTITTRVF